ncbi:MAG TPA: hypothetical protein VG890_06590 [Puia sp.]|nr:hypothetical protein [Puia sp.]
MIPAFREAYNEAFSESKYQAFLEDLNSKHPSSIEFRVAETPVFVPGDFRDKMINACEFIVDLIVSPQFKAQSEAAIPPGDRVPGGEGSCSFIAFDFGVCVNERGETEPQLIEMQGFPTLYGFQVHLTDVMRRHFPLPENSGPYLNGYTRETYLEELKRTILGDSAPEEVILLEIKPHEQKTRIDFYCTQDYLGIQPVCLTELIAEGDQLYYVNEQTKKKTRVRRIYNRVIFDDLHAQAKKLGPHISLQKTWDVEWVPHPNWFYRISKHTLPLIRHPYVPETFFLNEIKQPPADLENYVLKPLFSFAGQGVIIDVKMEDIEKIEQPENWILQRKVNYSPVIRTPGSPAKTEIRIMYLWPPGSPRPKAAINLARLSKGKMIGVRYNQNEAWVGGSVALFG